MNLCSRFCKTSGEGAENEKEITVSVNMLLAETEQGTVRGVIIECGEFKYVAFKGLPYAKPPLGKLRFKAPEPPEPWEGVREAVHHGPVCPQYNERMGRVEPGSEDCLYLNVYRPPRPATTAAPLPVMVWIHGGAFYTGSGDSDFYGPEFFMAHDVILVTFNYRLEVLGFLCLDNEEVPGNAGLKDQVAALKWVKKNIAAFGGDPNNVTLFGCSAGASSTSYHLLSDMSKGLFHKAICQSGICLSEWSYNPHARQRAFQLGKFLGKDTDDPQELLEFLRNVPARSLVNVKLPSLETKFQDIADSIFFGPVIEKPNINVEKFVSEEPPKLVREGRISNVPLILGYTSAEGIEIARKLPHILEFMKTTGAVVPRELKLQMSPEKLKDVDEKIRKHYFGDKEISMELVKEVVQFETDCLFSYNIQRFARYHVLYNTASVFMYKFGVETERNYTKKQYGMENIEGVCHADDLFYLFHVTCIDVPLTEESRGIIKKIVQLWTNFATTGKPTSSGDFVQWKPFDETERSYYIIGKIFECSKNQDDTNMKFWEQIYDETSIGLRNII